MDKDRDEIILNGIHGNELKALIDFCYTGDIEINEANAGALLQAASQLEFISVESECVNSLLKTLSVSNCLSICAEVEPFINFRELLNTVWTLIDENFVNIVENADEFLQLNEKFLQKLLMRDSLNIWSEEQVFNALEKWVEHDAKSRNKYVLELLSAIRLTQIKPKVSMST